MASSIATAKTGDGSTSWKCIAQSSCQQLLWIAAFLLAICPSVFKMYETSHWYREGDTSTYDDAKDWFGEANIPFDTAFANNGKTLMRVYYFIIPYILSALSVAAARAIQRPTIAASGSSTNSCSRSPPKIYLFIRALLGQTWTIPQPIQKYFFMPSSVSTAELIGVAAFLVVNIGTFAVRVKRSLPRGTRKNKYLEHIDEDMGKLPIEAWSWPASEVWAKTLGILAMLNIGWYLILPVGRRSVMLEALGLSWERAVRYHRWMGYYTGFLTFAHSVIYIAVWIYGDGNKEFDPEGTLLRTSLLPWGCSKTSDNCDEDTEYQLRLNMYGIVAFLAMLVMTVLAMPSIRRSRFELFYYAHHLFVVVSFFLALHYPGSFMYLIPGVAMYMVDKLYPLFSYRSAGTATTRIVSSDVIEIAVPISPTAAHSYRAGQYVFLNIPELSWLQWHPYSVTSSPLHDGTNRIHFHLKGAGTWTNSVIESAKAAKANGSDLLVRMDGFYGPDVVQNHLSGKQAVVLVGGGIGITPMVSLAMETVASSTSTHVTLLWVVRTIDEYSVLASDLAQAVAKYGADRLTVKVWITLSQPEPNAPSDSDDDEKNIGLTKDIIKTLAPDIIADRLRTILSESEARNNDSVSVDEGNKLDSRETKRQFVLDRSGFGPSLNALVLCMSVIVGLCSYAATWHYAEVNEIKPKEKETLFHIFSTVFGPAVFVAFVEGARLFYVSFQPPFNPSSCDSKNQVKELPDKTSDASASSEGNSSVSVVDDLLVSMCADGMGCRPNLAEEFSQLKSSGSNAINNVAVLACGPIAMVKTITSICNQPASGCSWGLRQSDGSEAYFDFTEEDWEW